MPIDDDKQENTGRPIPLGRGNPAFASHRQTQPSGPPGLAQSREESLPIRPGSQIKELSLLPAVATG